LPATVSVPVRVGPLVAATANVTLPAPFPLAPLLMLIHGALLVAVHAHPAAALTVTERVPPLASAE